MGFNATVVIGLDQLYWIETDPNFGKSLSLSVMQCGGRGEARPGPHGTMVVEMHHADQLVPVIVGGNSGTVIPAYVGINPNESNEATNLRVLKEMARVLGYRVSKVPKKRSQ